MKKEEGIPPSAESIERLKEFTRKVVTVSKAEIVEREKAHKRRQKLATR